ncbi:hypothetical protein LXL04_023715 [Taraxacum kok-saghyz]
MINVFNQMGHTPILMRLSAFKKNKLPSIWSCLFTILFKCLAERQTGTDSASKQFFTLLYALFTDSPIDLGKILWTQFCESPSSASRDVEISMGQTAKFPELQIGKLQIKSHSFCEFVGKIPEEMLIKIDSENELRKAYQLANPLPYLLRDTPEYIKHLIEKQKVVSRAQGKRNSTPTETSSPQPKKQKKSKKRKKTKTNLQDEDSKETESDATLRRSPGTQTPPHSPPHTSQPITSEPITTEPISTIVTEPISTSPLKNPPTTISITTSTFTPDYSEQMNNPITSIPITPTIPIPTSTATTQPTSTQIPLTKSPPRVTFVTSTTTNVGPDSEQGPEQPEKDSTVESDSELLQDFEVEELLPTRMPTRQPQNTQNISFSPLGVDDDISDDNGTVLFATKRDVKNVNRKLNVLIRQLEANSSSKPADTSSEVKELMKQSKEQMDAFLNTATNHIRDNANNMVSQLNTFKLSQQDENKLHLLIGQLDNKNNKLKEYLKFLDLKMHDKDAEINELRVQNFDLNKRLLNIAEAKEHPLLEKIEKMMDAKIETLSSSIHEKLLGRRPTPKATGHSSKQGGEGTMSTAGVSEEIPVSINAEMPFATSSSKIDFSKVASALSLPLIVTGRDGKQPMTSQEMECSELEKLSEEIKQKEAEKRNKANIDKDLEFIRPTWNKKTITDHVRNGRIDYWLIPRASFLAVNSLWEQPDFPMSNRAFVYKAFVINPEVRKNIKNLDSVLINFYAEKAQPQHLVWSTSKLVQLHSVGTEGWKNNTLINYRFQGFRGEEKIVCNFSCADLPLMNPYDWIKIHTMLRKRNDDRYKYYLNHITQMLKCYITEIAKEDYEIANRFKCTVKAPNDTSAKIKDVRDGSILTESWAVIYKTHEDNSYKTKIFYLNEKHLYSTVNLKTFMAKVEMNSNNSSLVKKHIYEVINWWIYVRNIIDGEIDFIFKASQTLHKGGDC